MTDGEAEDEIQFLRTVSTRVGLVCVCVSVWVRSGADAAGVTGIRPDLLNVGVRKQRVL